MFYGHSHASDFVSLCLGRHHKKKHVFFWALPELVNPPSPQFGQLGHLFSGRQNDRKNTNGGNFDDNDDKEHTRIISFE